MTAPPGDEDEFAALAVLAGLSGANSTDIALLRLLTEPRHNAWDGFDGASPRAVYETIDEQVKGPDDRDYPRNIATIAEVLNSAYGIAHPDLPTLSVVIEQDAEGHAAGLVVTATFRVPNLPALTLASFHDLDVADYRRTLNTGIEHALAIARHLTDAHAQLVKDAAAHGLKHVSALDNG